MKRALICGIGGQDGAYLAKFLLEKGYEVVGTSRDAMATPFTNLTKLGIREQVRTVSMAINDFRSVFSALKNEEPDEVYNLAGQSSVGLSFDQPVETMESIAIGTLNMLEAIRFIERPIHFYNAGSSECFGDTGNEKAHENTPFHPRSPYAVAKVSAHGLVVNYRESYGLFACTGILFNHESSLRPERFVTQKIIKAAARIANGSKEKLALGNLDIHRDWGWAPEYVEAMWLLMQRDIAEDFVIATGRTVSLQYFVGRAFEHFGLDWQCYVESEAALLRPSDIQYGRADASKAGKILNWHHKTDVDGVVEKMCDAAFNELTGVSA
ncbi:GDP-mannose 4,6-dehydratase [Mariprofundus sp. NF]|uniref:GDP-mannose 4,6-dehydratase n=1 Tax=Mariprofundus sp. NF TaxID=2608716 RepID=UPI0015A499C2|nr:GDP-mannose 4,6-dehydratase [Mariprofundus sp. NF]NWF37943.1 GDP-mannose 4,6-dehydratase [Mariprofundus sp. NF]